MDPLSIGLISGGANLLGSMFSGWQSGENTEANIAAQQAAQHQTMVFNSQQAEENRHFQREEAATNRLFQDQQVTANRRFQEQMSNTAYQRAMEDMKNAGLNPILAYQRGGATTPSGGAASGGQASGSSASVSTPNMALHNTRSPFEGIGDAVSKAVSSAVQMQTFNKMVEEMANIRADTAKTKAMEALTHQTHATEMHRTDKERETARSAHVTAETGELTKEEIQAVRNMPRHLRDILVQGSYGGQKAADVVGVLGSGAKAVRHLLPSSTTTERSTIDTSGRGTDMFERTTRGSYFGGR